VLLLYLASIGVYYAIPAARGTALLPPWESVRGLGFIAPSQSEVVILDDAAIEAPTQDIEARIATHFTDERDLRRPRNSARGTSNATRSGFSAPRARAAVEPAALASPTALPERAAPPMPPQPTRQASPKPVGSVQPIEGVETLDGFFRSLARTAFQKTAQPTRVVHIGDSLIESDLITSTLRRRLQGRFGNAGLGYVLPELMPGEQRRGIGIEVEGAWHEQRIQRDPDPDGILGLGGCALVAEPPFDGTAVTYDLNPPTPFEVAPSVVELALYEHPSGADYEVFINNASQGVYSSRSPSPRSTFRRFEVSNMARELRIVPRGEGLFRLLGISLESAPSGVIVDNIGQRSAVVTQLLRIDERHWREQFAWRQPSLIILSFGANQTSADNIDVESTARSIGRALERIRQAAPGASYLLMSALDRAVRASDGRFVTKPSVPRLVAAQRLAAGEHGWAFWDAYTAMGGANSMAAWFAADPPLAGPDLVHPTPRGMDRMGAMLYQSLLAAFAAHLDASPAALAAQNSSHAVQ